MGELLSYIICCYAYMIMNNDTSNDDKSSDEALLRKAVIGYSMTNTWTRAKKEWKLLTIYDEPYHGEHKHYIKEKCVIQNQKNKNELILENVWLNYFGQKTLRIPSKSRLSLSMLQEDGNISVNDSLLDVAVRLDIITEEQ